MHALYQPDTHYGAKSRSPSYLFTHDALTLMPTSPWRTPVTWSRAGRRRLRSRN